MLLLIYPYESYKEEDDTPPGKMQTIRKSPSALPSVDPTLAPGLPRKTAVETTLEPESDTPSETYSPKRDNSMGYLKA